MAGLASALQSTIGFAAGAQALAATV